MCKSGFCYRIRNLRHSLGSPVAERGPKTMAGDVTKAALLGQIVESGGVKIVGHANLPGRIAADSSALYARNLAAFVGLLFDKDGALAPDFDDEILKAALITKDGQIVNSALQA